MRDPAVDVDSRPVEAAGDEEQTITKSLPRNDAPVDEPYRPFPVDALPEPLRELVGAVADSTGCPPSFVALPALAVCAGAIGNSCRAIVKRGWIEPSVLWCATIGRSGSLKSPAADLVLRPVFRAQHRAIQAHREATEDYEQDRERHDLALREWRRDGARSDRPVAPEPPPLRRTVVSDTTIEALAPILAGEPRGVLAYRDELSAWVGSFDRYASGRGADAASWCSIYDARPVLVDRKTGERTVYVPSAAVSVAGSIQPGVARRVFGPDLRESGLLGRVMVAMPPTEPALWTDAELAGSVEERWAQTVSALLSIEMRTDDEGAPRPRYIPLDLDARNRYRAWHDAHARATAAAESDDLAAALAKAKGRCVRLALVLHCVRVAAGEEVSAAAIDVESVESAIAVSEWSIREARRLLALWDGGGLDAEAGRLLDWIDRRGGRTTARDLARYGPRRYRAPGAAEEALHSLAAAGHLRRQYPPPSPRGGQPLVVYARGDGGDGDSTGPGAPASRGSVAVARVARSADTWVSDGAPVPQEPPPGTDPTTGEPLDVVP